MNTIRRIVAFLAAVVALTPCGAETLEDAWTIAIASDLSLQAVRSQSAAVESNLAAAKSNRYPILELDSAFTQLDEAPSLDTSQSSFPLSITLPNVFSGDNYITANARVRIPLYTSGLISSGINSASTALSAARAREEAFVQEVKLGVAVSFVTVLRAQRAVEVATTNVTSLKAHARDVDNLYQKGLVPMNDLLAVEVSLADAQQVALQARNKLDIARAAYNRRLGRELDQGFMLEEVMPAVAAAAMSTDIDTLTRSALETRTELKALLDQSSALRHQADAELARIGPQFAASAGYTYLENEVLNDDTFASASVGFTWSPFDGGRTRHRANSINRQAKSVSQQHDDLVAVVRLQVRSAWLDVEEARQRLAVTGQAITRADENLRVARDRYKNGIGTNTEVLDAETLRTLTQSNHNNARYDAALSRLRLAWAIGVL